MIGAVRIDAHHHFWRLSRGDYAWLTPALAPIHRDFLPEELLPLLARCGIERTILVQAAASEAETRFLLEIAASASFVAGVVGWVDFTAGDALLRLEQAAGKPRLVGLRPMLQDLPDDAWLLRPQLGPVFGEMARRELRFDALVAPRHLENLITFARRHPDLRIVVDHGAKPCIARGELHGWANTMRRLASETQASCKLSGLITEAGPGWSVTQLRPYVEVLLEAFGPHRLMWGSDWPVLNLAGDYAGWAQAAAELIASLSRAEQSRIMGQTAAEFYGIPSAST